MNLNDYRPLPEILENPTRTYFEIAQYAAIKEAESLTKEAEGLSQEAKSLTNEANEALKLLQDFRDHYDIFGKLTREYVTLANSETVDS